MSELSRDELVRISQSCGAMTGTGSIQFRNQDGSFERFAAAIYEAGAKSERAVSDRLLEALKLADIQYMGCGGNLTPDEVVSAMRRVIQTSLAEVEALRAQQAAMRKEKPE